MAGLSSREKDKLKKLRKAARDNDDSMDILRLSDFAQDMNEKYGAGTVDDPADVYNKGGDVKKKKKVPVIAISVGMADMPKNGKGKAKMMRGGMANGKPHMYSNGGSVTDKLNPGLRALQKERPDVVANILKKS
tara:strand:- start:342 stop:743 length:402 start_codon:yes stop_codon:yes gene_type:complete